MKKFLCIATTLSSLVLTSCFEASCPSAPVDKNQTTETRAPKHADNIIYLHEQITKDQSAQALFSNMISSGPVVVDFYAVWCGPCKSLSKTLEEVAKEFPQVKFIKIDVDQVSSLDSSIKSIPLLRFYKDGVQKEERVGSLSATSLRSLIKQIL